MRGSVKEALAEATRLEHLPVWDPPEIVTAAQRWTCDCGHAVMRYGNNIYGSAIEVECPNRGSRETQSTQ